MGKIKTLGYSGPAGAWRNYNTVDVPATEPYSPEKARIAALMDYLDEQAMAAPFLEDFAEGVGTGVAANDDAAMALAIAWMNSEEKGQPIRLMCKKYEFEDDYIFPYGGGIIGVGSGGTNPDLGTFLVHHSNGTFLRWDGSGGGPSGLGYSGTGQVIQNLGIVKGDGFSGGRAIYFYNIDDAHRVGEIWLSNVFMGADGSGAGTGRWSVCLEADGLLTNTPGGRGVRHLHMYKVRGSAHTTANKTFHFKQVTSLFCHDLAADGGGADPGVYFEGINEYVFMESCRVGGTVEIIADGGANLMGSFYYQGHVGVAFINNSTGCDGHVELTECPTVVNKGPKLQVDSYRTPDTVYARRTTNQDNITGAGGTASVIMNVERWDPAGLWNTTTGVFTSRNAGMYQVDVGVLVAGLAAGNTAMTLAVNKTGVQAGSNSAAWSRQINPSGALFSSQYHAASLSFEVALWYGDTLSISLNVSGGTDIVDVFGASSPDYTYCSISYIGPHGTAN